MATQRAGRQQGRAGTTHAAVIDASRPEFILAQIPVIWIGRTREAFEARMQDPNMQRLASVTKGVKMLADPCFPARVWCPSTATYKIVAQDLRHSFEPRVWDSQVDQAASVGCMISHMRAWHQLTLEEGPTAWGIVMEADVCPKAEVTESLAEVEAFMNSAEGSWTEILNMCCHLTATHSRITTEQQPLVGATPRDRAKSRRPRYHHVDFYEFAHNVRERERACDAQHQTFGMKLYAISGAARAWLRDWKIHHNHWELGVFEETFRRAALRAQGLRV